MPCCYCYSICRNKTAGDTTNVRGKETYPFWFIRFSFYLYSSLHYTALTVTDFGSGSASRDDAQGESVYAAIVRAIRRIFQRAQRLLIRNFREFRRRQKTTNREKVKGEELEGEDNVKMLIANDTNEDKEEGNIYRERLIEHQFNGAIGSSSGSISVDYIL